MKRTMLFLASLLLAGCGATRPADPPAPIVTEVRIPVRVECIEEVPKRPDLVTDEELLQLDDGDFVTALHIDRLRRDGYEAQLEAAVEGCL